VGQRLGIEFSGTKALETAFHRGALVAAAPVFAELIATPGHSEAFVVSFFEETGIGIDWELPEQIWRLAGRAFQAYAERRRKQRDAGARRTLADFVIGAHASANSCRLLTLDDIGCIALHFQRSQ
jgi:predicted nucleic acid-binding protein